jgi:hypothetical protein
VITETNAKATLHQRAMHELKELVFIFSISTSPSER